MKKITERDQVLRTMRRERAESTITRSLMVKLARLM